MALFLRRATAARPDFRLTAGNAAAVAALCARLDGLPLAIELAAARVKLLDPAALLARLADGPPGARLALLTGGARDLPERQRTLRRTLDWSHALLSPPERRLFRRLAPLVGDADLEAVEALAAAGATLDGADTHADDAPQALDLVGALLDQSLLRRVPGARGADRFGYLETVREYAAERLREGGEEAALRRAHAAHYLALAERAAQGLTGPRQVAWLDRLEADHDNLRAALDWALAAGEGMLALRLAGALGRFWLARGFLREGRRRLADALALSAEEPAALRAPALHDLGVLARYLGDDAIAGGNLAVALDLWRRAGDEAGVATALNALASLALRRGDIARATALYEESLALRARRGDRLGVSACLLNLGNAALLGGEPARAAARFADSLAIARELGNPRGVAFALLNGAWAALARDDAAAAAAALAEGVPLLEELGDRYSVAEALAALASLAALRGRATLAARTAGAAAALHDALGSGLLPYYRAIHDGALERVRGHLGPLAFGAALAAGRATSPEAALAAARALLASPRGMDADASEPPADLSPREVEVLRLLALGHANREIAAVLSLSVRTVERHLENLYGKLGVHGRAAAASFAARQGLL